MNGEYIENDDVEILLNFPSFSPEKMIKIIEMNDIDTLMAKL